MSFVVVTCPGCQRETLLDEIDGRGFCMYCGTALDTSKDESFDLPDMFGETVHMMVDMAKELDFTKEPWYEEIEGTLDRISAGEYADAADMLSEDLRDRDVDTRDDIRRAAIVRLISGMLESSSAGEPYKGGIVPLADILQFEGLEDEEPLSTPELILTIVDSLASPDTVVAGEDSAYGLMTTAFRLVRDLVEIDPDIMDQVMAAKRLMDMSEMLSETLREMDPDSDVADDIDYIFDAASCLYDAATAVMMEMDDDTIEQAVERNKADWGLGEVAAELISRIDDQGFDPSEVFWDTLEKDSADYVSKYFGQ